MMAADSRGAKVLEEFESSQVMIEATDMGFAKQRHTSINYVKFVTSFFLYSGSSLSLLSRRVRLVGAV